MRQGPARNEHIARLRYRQLVPLRSRQLVPLRYEEPVRVEPFVAYMRCANTVFFLVCGYLLLHAAEEHTRVHHSTAGVTAVQLGLLLAAEHTKYRKNCERIDCI